MGAPGGSAREKSAARLVGESTCIRALGKASASAADAPRGHPTTATRSVHAEDDEEVVRGKGEIELGRLEEKQGARLLGLGRWTSSGPYG